MSLNVNSAICNTDCYEEEKKKTSRKYGFTLCVAKRVSWKSIDPLQTTKLNEGNLQRTLVKHKMSLRLTGC